MTVNPPAKLISEEDALLNLRNAFYQLQHHEVALDELWEGTDEGRSLSRQSLLDRQLKEIADQADRLRVTLDLVCSVRRYQHLLGKEPG